MLGTLLCQPPPNFLPIISSPLNHDQEPLQVNTGTVYAVFVLEVTAEIVFALNRVTSCSPVVFAAIHWTSVARPRLVDIVDMATKILGKSEGWYIAATIALVRSSGDG